MNKQKAIKKYDKLLKKFIENKDIVKIEREFTEGDSDIHGFLLDLSKGFILVQKEEDFLLVGYAIVPKDRFDSIRNNKFDKTTKEILEKEGIIENNYGIDVHIDITDWQSIFTSLKNLDYCVIVECEDLKKPKFLIGPIVDINKKSVSIQYFDATGLLDSKPTKVKYNDITIIRFEERYINVFRKHLKTKKKKK